MTSNILTNEQCRGCLEKSKEMRSIFQKEKILKREFKLSVILNYCTNLDVINFLLIFL